MAAFHFTMEAAIKKDQQKLEVFQNIGAISALKEVASSPDEVAAKFASEALTIIGEEVVAALLLSTLMSTTNYVCVCSGSVQTISASALLECIGRAILGEEGWCRR